MTVRQSVLKNFYPLLMKVGGWFGAKTAIEKNRENVKPNKSFYELNAAANNNTDVQFAQFKGNKVLLVNIASDCGYTNQLSELQKLHEQYKNMLVIIGFPANDFKEQEKGTDSEIESFCKVNYGVEFMLMKKSTVIKGEQQNEVYQWLTDRQKNGWNDKAPEWNFSKYLVDEDGTLTHYFGPAVSPLSKTILQLL